MHSKTYFNGPCPKCGSDDFTTTNSYETVAELDIAIKHDNCNPCPFQERWIHILGRLVYHDISDGNTMRVITPEFKN